MMNTGTSGLVVTISFLALSLSGYAAFYRDAAAPLIINSEVPKIDLRDEVELERRISNLESLIRKIPTSNIVSSSLPDNVEVRLSNLENVIQRSELIAVVSDEQKPRVVSDEQPNRVFPRYLELISPEMSVSVQQDEEDGSIRVQNMDPALSGKYLMVAATREDGSTTDLPIVVPEPR